MPCAEVAGEAAGDRTEDGGEQLRRLFGELRVLVRELERGTDGERDEREPECDGEYRRD